MPAPDPWEWLSLVDADGPFLSKAALKSFYKQGLPKPDDSLDDANATFIDEHTRWIAAWTAAGNDSDEQVYTVARDRWVKTVLHDLLRWGDELNSQPAADLQYVQPGGSIVVRPFATLGAGEAKPELLVTVVERTEDLRKSGTDVDGWSASAIDRAALLARATGVSLGIVTDGRWWALVSAVKERTTASGVWDALLWREERPSRDAFFALASFDSIAGGHAEQRLVALFGESIASAEEITEALGDQVRRAVELVLQSFSDTHIRALARPGGVPPLPADAKVVYEGAVTMLMRVVFLLFAEERELLPQQDLYRSAYAIAGVRQQLERELLDAADASVLDGRSETWHRLIAASNAVFGGVSFEDIRMPAYGGSLFDPSRFQWLHATDADGRLAIRVSDRAMLEVLRAVQIAEVKGEARNLSFRDLDVEQIGYVYEGLLGYSAEYTSDIVVGLQSVKSGYEPEILLTELESLAVQATTPDDFAKRLTVHLKKTQEHSRPKTANQLAKAYSAKPDEAVIAAARTRLSYVLIEDPTAVERLLPFHALIRSDLRESPYVVPAGGIVMTESPQRANTGTHYTPKALAEEVVLHALEPLVYSPGPLDVEDPAQWRLRSSAEILDLKVADIAAGSGAFLVAAARYLADRLLEARAVEGRDVGAKTDLRQWAVREVVGRCLYGADINGMAVEMCKLSLWLISLDPDKPFSFVDDRVFHGNSLLGITTEAQLKAQHIYPKQSMKRQLAAFDVDKDLEDAACLRRELASGQVDNDDPARSTRAKRALLAQSKEVTAKLRDVADGIIAAGLLEGGKPGRKLEERYHELAEALREAYPADGSAGERRRLDAIIGTGLTPEVDTGEARWKPLHWILEAPDVMHDHGGFDAILGNPPFLGGQRISGSMGGNARDWLVQAIAAGHNGSADLVVYFLLRARELTASGATLAILATKTIAQGDSRRVGLDRIVDESWTIHRAIRSRRWPASGATVDFAAVWLIGPTANRGTRPTLEGQRVREISSLLEATQRVAGLPTALAENAGVSYIGSYILGQGFVLTHAEARAMVDADPRNADVIRPYLTGADLNGTFDSKASRHVIDFRDMTIDQAARYSIPFERVQLLVQPERARNNRKLYRDYWWQYAEKRPGLIRAIANLERVLAITLTSNAIAPQFVEPDQVIDQTAPIFATDDFGHLAVLNSNIHRTWAIKYATTFGSGFRYSLKKAFQTFPFPHVTENLRLLGAKLEEKRGEAKSFRSIGLTKLYNLIADPAETDDDIDAIRQTEAEIDEAMMQAYGWTDVPLEHGFHTYRQMERWTVSPAARVEILDRLLEENHRRAAIEAQHNPKKADKGKSFEESDKPEGALI